MKHKAAFQLERHGSRVVYRLTWGEVRRILGRDHANTAADDAKLARALRAAGARPLGKSYAKEDGWHAFAPKGTPMPALTKRRNPAEGDDEADPHPGDFRKPIERVDASISEPALRYMRAQRSAAQAAGKKHRAKPASVKDLEWAHQYARRLHYSAKDAMESADAGKKYKGPHDAAYLLGMMEGALAVEDAIAGSVAPLRAASQERGGTSETEPGILSRLVSRVKGYASKAKGRDRAAPKKAARAGNRPKARKRAKPSR